jgi:ABC-type bacteriocin/lantibiotic exporter with double-glycine peptidase domain
MKHLFLCKGSGSYPFNPANIIVAAVFVTLAGAGMRSSELVSLSGSKFACGPAALALSAQWLGHKVSYQQIQEMRHGNRDSVTSFQELRDIAEKMGLAAVAVRAKSILDIPWQEGIGGVAQTVYAESGHDRKHFVSVLYCDGRLRIFSFDYRRLAFKEMARERFDKLYQGNMLLISKQKDLLSSVVVRSIRNPYRRSFFLGLCVGTLLGLVSKAIFRTKPPSI